MPTLKVARSQAANSSLLRTEFESAWKILDPSTITHDGQGSYSYVGTGITSSDGVALIKTKYPLDPNRDGGMSCFEMTLTDTGESNFISIGVCSDTYPSQNASGSHIISVTLHVDDGKVFKTGSEAILTNQPCMQGDTVKCGVIAVPTNKTQCRKAEVAFYRNGQQIASVLTDIPPGGLYGGIGMLSKGEKISLFPPFASQRRDFNEIWEIRTPQHILHKEDGICMYTGSGDSSSECSIGSVRGKNPINPVGKFCDYSLRLRILNSGGNGYIGVGIVDSNYPPSLLPGWEDTSIGYHADNGRIFQSSNDGYPTNLPCSDGDMMQCIVQAIDNSPKQIRVTFFRNSTKVTELTAWTPQTGFFFCFGMMSKNEVVQVILPEVSVPFTVPKLSFADVWDVMNPYMEHQEYGICKYIGNGEVVGSIRSKQPIDPFGSANSYQVKIIDPGKKCYIALGVCSNQYSSDDLPGWEDSSVGYHADNGCIIQKSTEEEITRISSHEGDVIRCILEPVDGGDKQMNVVFHKNDNLIGSSIFWRPSDSKVFAQIGCMSGGEIIQIASPLQAISNLKPDVNTPVQDNYPSMGEAMKSPNQDPTMSSLNFNKDGSSTAQMPRYPPSLNPPSLNPNEQIEMQHFLYQMYQQLRAPRSAILPWVDSPQGYPGPRYSTPLSHGFRPRYPGHVLPPLDYSISYPPPVYSPSGDSTSKQLYNQQSVPVSKGYYSQASTSSSDSEAHSLLASQVSMSSQFSTSSFESSPGNTSIPPVEEERSTLSRTALNYGLVSPSDTIDSGNYSSLINQGGTPADLQSLQTTVDSCVSTTPSNSIDNDSLISTVEPTTSLLSRTDKGLRVQRSPSIIVHPTILNKDENKVYKILHNMTENYSEGSLEYTNLNPGSPENAFAIFRLPLSEKLNYYEIELMEVNIDTNISVGLVWDHYPVYRLPGILEGSIAFHTKDSVICSGGETSSTDFSCRVGDVIGCRADLQFKHEVGSPQESINSHINIELFRNGLSFYVKEHFLPPNGFFPAIGLTGLGTKVAVRQKITLTPESYFETNPYPDNYSNFPAPPPENEGWQCLQNSKLDGSNLFTQGRCSPAIVQNILPFTSSSNYFQIQLPQKIRLYSVVSIGVVPKLPSDDKKMIPGESADSVGYLPLLGFVMSKGRICCTVPEVVNSALHKKETTIGVGVDYPGNSSTSLESSKMDLSPTGNSERVMIFFTVNNQQVSSIITKLPKGGFYPTLAIEKDCSTGILATLLFPKQFPCINKLPIGFARGPEEGLLLKRDSYTVEDCNEDGGGENISIRGLQAARPLSPSKSYFEIKIHRGGDNFNISCGVASYDYPLNIHPGCKQDSIAFHVNSGKLLCNGSSETVTSSPCYDGVIIGCGARFPNDGSATFAEIYMSINRKIISCRLVKIPQMGLFPTVGFSTKRGIFSIDLTALDPHVDLRFRTVWGLVDNIKIDGTIIQPLSPNPGAIQMEALTPHESHFFSVSCLSERNGRIMIGFSTSKSCPLNFLKSQAYKACVIDIVSGRLMIYNTHLKAGEACIIEGNTTFGVGIKPLYDSKNGFLLFFTADDYIISYAEIEIPGEDIYPCMLMLDSTTKLNLDMCAAWPKITPIGSGWARYANLTLKDCKITHSFSQTKKRLPVGFAQAGIPLSLTNSYFEIEICSRNINKAIAIGLASRTHPVNQWIGWSKGSIGYHVDDGKLFKESNFGQSFGPKAYNGDSIGCGVRFHKICQSAVTTTHETIKVEVYFTINGALLNTQKMKIPCGGFFPTVCLESSSEAVFFHQYETFPPVANLVGSDWANAYSVKQIGNTIKNCCRHKEINGGFPKGFCQAKNPFSVKKPYFSVDITSLDSPDKGQIHIGAFVKIPVGCTTPNTHSMTYSSSGSIITRKGSQKYTQDAPRCHCDDNIGCAILYDADDKPKRLAIYINHAQVYSSDLPDILKEQLLYPTIMLRSLGNSVIPSLGLPLPSGHRHLIGWLRSERVRMQNNVIEYLGDGKSGGVIQTSQPLQLDVLAYYEIEILDPGEKCTIAIGAASADYPLTEQPGWCKNSIAYHGDDGKLFYQCSVGAPFASTWKKHDIIGLGIRSSLQTSNDTIQVYFTKNGVELGHVTTAYSKNGYYPTIGFHSRGEKVRIYMGGISLLPDNSNQFILEWRCLSGIRLVGKPDSQILCYKCNGRTPQNSGTGISLSVYDLPFSEAMQYFEIQLDKIGPNGIAIGVTPDYYPIDLAPGWSHDSIAYHTDDGKLYHSSSKGKEFGPIAHIGDVIGCGVSFIPSSTKHCSIFFTYNGMEIGRVRASCPPNGLYPSIALTHVNDKITVKFHKFFKQRVTQSVKFVGLMRINNCSYSEQIVIFKGLGSSGYSSSPAVAQFAVPLSREHHYYAASIIECNDAILIGLAVKDYPLRYAPGTTSVSVAYDIMNGNIKAVYNSENFYSIDAPNCSRGDVVGCGVHFTDSSKTEKAHIFFTKNNELIGKIEINEEVFLDELYPIIGFVPHNKQSFVFMDWNATSFTRNNI